MAMIHPDLWNSAYRPILYRVQFPALPVFSAIAGVGGAKLNVGIFFGFFTVGQKVYVMSGPYQGTWTVLANDGFDSITINAPFTTTTNTQIKPLQTVNAELWAGYQSTHEGYPIHPYRRIASITQPPNLAGETVFDVSGYIQGLFKEVTVPVLGADFSMSIPFRLIVSGETQFDRYAINGTLPHTSLAPFNADFATLNSQDPIHFVNGVCFYSMIWPDTSVHGEHIVNVLGVDGSGISSISAGIGFDTIGGTFIVG